MLKIRLTRKGKKAQPFFHVIVQEHTMPVKGGNYVEDIGSYSGASAVKKLDVKMDRVKYWLSMGATPSSSLAVLLKKEGVEGMEKYIEKGTHKAKKKKGGDEAAAETSAGAAPAAVAPAAPAESAPASEAPAAPEAPAEPAAPTETPAQ